MHSHNLQPRQQPEIHLLPILTVDKTSAPTLSPLRKGLAEATKRPQASANPFGIPPLRKPLASRTLAALLFFAAVNVIWGIGGFGKLAPDDFSYDTWTSCAITDYLHGRKSAPDVAFLGSSLILYPAGGVDADLYNKTVDGPRHHSSDYFEKKFQERTGQKISTFDFALPGEMPSDAFMINKFIFKERKPNVIVYGVGPRDFMDNLLPSPSATDPFHHLARFGDYNTLIDKISPQLEERFNYEMSRLSFPYGHKEDLVHAFTRNITNIANAELVKFSVPIVPLKIRRKLMPDYRASEVGVEECLFQPYVDRPRPAFTDNIEEYRKRYKDLKWNTFLDQMDFLSRTIDTAKERGTKFVLVSMPITEINRQLLSPKAKAVFKETLHVLATNKGVTFIDLDGTPNYQLADFEDTVHLHSGGGRKMLSAIAEELARNNDLRSAVSHNAAGKAVVQPGVAGKSSETRSKSLATRKESFL